MSLIDGMCIIMFVATLICGFKLCAILRKGKSIWFGFVEFPSHEIHKDKCQTYIHDKFIIL